MRCLKKLGIILQSKGFYFVLFLIISSYIILTTIVIKYESKIVDATSLEGYVVEETKKDDKITFVLKTPEKVKCTIYLNDDTEYDNLLGKKVLITGKLSTTYNNTIPNTFNYANYLYNNKIYQTVTVSDIKVLAQENMFYSLKNKIRNRLDEFPDSIKSYLNLFILGDKNYLDADSLSNYKTNGVWHLFAISGMHISLIIVLLETLFKKFKFKDLIVIIILSYFMFLTSFSASVMRAVIFYMLKTILKWLNINLSNIKILFLTAFIILLINPFMIYNTGFLYSFLITLSIMLMSLKITGNYFVKIFKISLIATIVSLPITVNMNYEINLLSIFLNMIFVPLVSTVIFPFSLLTFLLPFLSPLLNILINILEFLNKMGNLFKILLIIPKMSFYLIIFYYLFIIFFYRKSQKRYLALAILVVIFNIIIPKLDRNYYVYYLDVGQGDSSLLISPHQKEVIMIDTGGAINSDYHVSDNVITFLKSLGINKIDLLIISHGDADHAKETLNYLEKYKISNIILNKGKDNNLEKEIKSKGHVVNSYESKSFNFLNIDKYYSDDENASSMITYVDIYNKKFLFMGDAPQSEEQLLLQDYNLECDFIKLGHHGSYTSSGEEFLKHFNLKLAIISSGRNNMYHHPSKQTLDTLDKLHINYLNTQTSGTVELILQKNNYKIKMFKP